MEREVERAAAAVAGLGAAAGTAAAGLSAADGARLEELARVVEGLAAEQRDLAAAAPAEPDGELAAELARLVARLGAAEDANAELRAAQRVAEAETARREEAGSLALAEAEAGWRAGVEDGTLQLQVCRGTWARVTIDRFRHLSLQTFLGYRSSFNILTECLKH